MFPAKMPCQLRPGHVLNGKYQIGEELGSGGFGCVYAAQNLNLHTRVAIKLRREPGPDARLWREAQLAAALRSPNSVRIFDVDRLDDGTPYIVMEFLEGQTLREYLRNARKASLERAVTWTLQICSALGEAHAAGLVHRDVKPSNLFLVDDNRAHALVKLVDFGLARHVEDKSYDSVTDSGVVVGSPAYMAPERVRAGAGTAQTDIWSVGVVLFEMLTGELPFEGETNSALLAAIVADPPRPLLEVAPELPAALGAIIARCLRKRADDRYASADALAHDLRQFSSASPVRTPSDDTVTVSATIATSAASAGRRGPSRWRLLFLVGLLGVPLMGWLFSLIAASNGPEAESARGSKAVSVTKSAAKPAPSPGDPSTSGREQLRPAEPFRPSASSPDQSSKPRDQADRPRARPTSVPDLAEPGLPVRAQHRSHASASARAPGAFAPANASAAPRLITEPDF